MASKIILFYKYVDIVYPVQVQKWQKKLCEALGLKGRIIIAQEGINGTLGGSVDALEEYKKVMSGHPLFGNIDFKEGQGDAECFPRLRIVVKNEICHLGLDIKKYPATQGGIHLSPEQTHELIQNKKDLIILDTRNTYEARVGKFVDAIIPPIDYFRQFPEYIDNNIDLFKDKEVLMYCTGGVRCERATTYLKSKNVAKEIYQIQGGIHRYIEKFPDGFFRGKNYVFDARVTVRVNDDVVGSCDICQQPNDDITNCINAQCNKQFIACPPCLQKQKNTCCQNCLYLVENRLVVIRKQPKKIDLEKR